MDIEILVDETAEYPAIYVLRHDYDTQIFSGLPGDGPFSSYQEARAAADRLSDALSCVAD
jgi:hypothetical protein